MRGGAKIARWLTRFVPGPIRHAILDQAADYLRYQGQPTGAAMIREHAWEASHGWIVKPPLLPLLMIIGLVVMVFGTLLVYIWLG